jgi:NADP-dependent 3-hydroxy acid dehydrogenase YdfG
MCACGGADITDHEQATAAVQSTIDEWGSLDIVVNNAGTSVADAVADVERSQWRQMLDITMDGTIHGCTAASGSRGRRVAPPGG